MNDWEDRLVDASLQELHGSKPPDLSSRVLMALREAPPGELPRLRRAHRRPHLLWALLAAGVLLATLVIAWWLPGSAPSADQLVAQLDVTVLGGVLESVEFGGEEPKVGRHGTGTITSFAARAGNRLRSQLACMAQLGPFGVLAVGPHTELEVQSMEFSLKHGVLAASSLTLAVVAGTATWYTLSRTETATAGSVLRLEANPDAASAASALATENERLRQRVQELERQNEAMHVQPARTGVPLAQPEGLEPPPPPQPQVAATPAAMTFADAKFGDALAAVDWKLVGDVTNEMGPMLAQLVEEMRKTGDVSTELAIKVQELNGKLVKQALVMLKAGLPGFETNGAYTHPLVTANTLASTLAAAGQPLTEAQRATMGGLVRTFSVENQSIADASREFDLEHLLAETEMKDRFYKEMSTLLTPDQYRTMYPEGSEANDGASLFGTGLMTRPYTEAVPSANAADFARLASNKLGEAIGLDEASAAKVRSVVERMSSASPELWQDPATATENGLRMLKRGRTPAALRRQLEVMREIQRSVTLTPEQQKKLRSLKHILVPLPKG